MPQLEANAVDFKLGHYRDAGTVLFFAWICEDRVFGKMFSLSAGT